MRGKVFIFNAIKAVVRITPAYAGKSALAGHHPAPLQDHPRLCGEKHLKHVFEWAFVGSPPPMRGKVMSESWSRYETRITPAYAGKRYFSIRVSGAVRDHPRLCGEKRFAPASSSLVRGSPPPMRGKTKGFWSPEQQKRITPAYAGKSMPAPPASMPARDHPRLCGEKTTSILSKQTVTGSPPPMRGKVSKLPSSRYAVRITPAYAGKRSCSNTVNFPNRDHPRLCGEKYCL